MTHRRITPVYLVILCLFFNLSACQNKPPEAKPAPTKDEFESLQSPLEDLETNLLAMIGQVDLIPYYEKQIQAKKQQEEEQKQTTPPVGAKEQSVIPPKEKFTPEPIMLNDALLKEVIKPELPEESRQEEEPLPDDIVFIWADINTQITRLHEQWNELKPKLAAAQVSETALTDFGNALNLLTVTATEKKHIETLLNANLATAQVAEFMKISKDQAYPALYAIKYYTRQIVLNEGTNNSMKAQEHFQSLQSQSETLTAQLIENDAKTQADQLKVAVEDLGNALTLEDLNLLKLKAGVVTKNIIAIKETLAKK